MTHGELAQSALLEGRAAWPDVSLDTKVLTAYCERIAEGRDAGDPLPFAADLYLACACENADPAAMAALELRHARAVRAAIARYVSDPDLAAEVAQEFWARLFCGDSAKIRGYSGRGPLGAWLRVVATRLTLDGCRARRREAQRRAELHDDIAGSFIGEERRLEEQRYTPVLQAAVKRAIAQLSPRERNVLRMHAVSHLGIDDIGRVFGVHRATAARWLERLRRTIRDTAREHFAEAYPGVTSSEFMSLARALERNIDVSLSAWRETDAASARSRAVSVSGIDGSVVQ